MREVICFIFNHIPSLSGLSGSARGRKCVILSDNRGKKPRDRHIHLGDTVKRSQLALPFTVSNVIVFQYCNCFKALFLKKNAFLSYRSSIC